MLLVVDPKISFTTTAGLNYSRYLRSRPLLDCAALHNNSDNRSYATAHNIAGAPLATNTTIYNQSHVV